MAVKLDRKTDRLVRGHAGGATAGNPGKLVSNDFIDTPGFARCEKTPRPPVESLRAGDVKVRKLN